MVYHREVLSFCPAAEVARKEWEIVFFVVPSGRVLREGNGGLSCTTHKGLGVRCVVISLEVSAKTDEINSKFGPHLLLNGAKGGNFL